MHKTHTLMFLVLAPALLTANESVGTITSPGALTLRGVALSAGAVRSLPLFSGDEVVTHEAPAVMFLMDKSHISIDGRSRFVLAEEGGSIKLCLEEGSIVYEAPAGSRLVVCASGGYISLTAPARGRITILNTETVQVVEQEGKAETDETEMCTCGVPTGKKPAGAQARVPVKVLIITGAVAGAAGAAIIAGHGDKEEPLSPSKP